MTSSGPLGPGHRRAVPVEPVLAVDAGDRAALLEQALADPGRCWWVQEFDGRDFRTAGVVRGAEARGSYLAGGGPALADEDGGPRASDP